LLTKQVITASLCCASSGVRSNVTAK